MMISNLSLTPSLPRSSATFGHADRVRQSSTGLDGAVATDMQLSESSAGMVKAEPIQPASTVPEVNVNGSPVMTRKQTTSSLATKEPDLEEKGWGANFWVTLVNPQTEASFYACPATGEVSWDPPVGHFVLPPNPDGEWWEIYDESRGGIPYYYQTKSGETVWERPEGFVIPLGILQNTALGRRLSQTAFSSYPHGEPSGTAQDSLGYRRSHSHYDDEDPARNASGSIERESSHSHNPQSSSPPGKYVSGTPSGSVKKSVYGSSQGQVSAPRRSFSTDTHQQIRFSVQQLPPIPASPAVTDTSTPSVTSQKSTPFVPVNGESLLGDQAVNREKDMTRGKVETLNASNAESLSRARSKSYIQHRSPQPQSLNAAVELFTSGHSPPQGNKRAHSDGGHGSATALDGSTNLQVQTDIDTSLHSPDPGKGKEVPPSPKRPIPAPPGSIFWTVKSTASSPLAGKEISSPMLNQEATLNMSPVKSRLSGKPILVDHAPKSPRPSTALLSSGTYPVLPHDLASDIQQFVESDYAKQYFSTHRTGFIFRRRVPVEQMMTWQRAPLSSPLLTLNRALGKDALKIFKFIQHIMGDRIDRPAVARAHSDLHQYPFSPSINASTTSLNSNIGGLLEEERWLLGEGLTHGELRDEIYCQLMKQLTGNPNTESVFKGWQLLCVLLITFPPSKNFETYLRSFIQQRTSIQEGRVDIMAKHCLKRLIAISKRGPRGKPPTLAEIETASDAAFNPSTFGESLDAIIRLQERNYPHLKIPIILPFLADGILALGGTKSEGIFRVPGDGDLVSELKLRIDRGYYTLDNVDDPHVLASLLKLWLRELCDPLVPDEMYNECVISAQDPEACIQIVERLPTVNRRVVLFIISFLQLFLEEKIQNITKMTPSNLALVMAPNLLRCNSESMSVVFTNAQYEQVFVYHLLLHLKCNEVDLGYTPTHGLGSMSAPSLPRLSKSRVRRPKT